MFPPRPDRNAPSTPATPADQTIPVPPQANESSSGVPERPASFTEVFANAVLNLQSGSRKQELEATVAFDKNAFWLLDPRGTTLKVFRYTNIKIAEYSYSKSPRWKNVGSGAPSGVSGGGTRHWFMIQTQNDYTLISLDKENYRSVVGAFEIRSGKTVETAAESK